MTILIEITYFWFQIKQEENKKKEIGNGPEQKRKGEKEGIKLL